jgi:hypothetical protein
MYLPQYDGGEDFEATGYAHRSLWHTGPLSPHPHYVCGHFPCSPASEEAQDDYLRKILLLFFDSFVPEVDCPKAVNDVNAILATFPSGIRVQVIIPMYQAYGIEMTHIPTPAEIGQLVETLNCKSQVFRNFGMP